MRRGLFVCALLMATLFGCSGGSQDVVELDLWAQGTEVQDVALSEELSVTLERADVAFGPLYLCPGTQAGELCDVARLEWTSSAVVNALDEGGKSIGRLQGATGPIRSWMFDYGITSVLTSETPLVLEAANSLGDVSAVIAGEAQVQGTTVPFRIAVIVEQGEGAEAGVQVVRKSSSDAFEFEVTEDSSTFQLTFDPADWLTGVGIGDFEDAAVGCQLGVDEVCDPVDWGPETAVARGVSQAMVAGRRPSFSLR